MFNDVNSIEQLTKLAYQQLTLVDFSIAYIYLYVVYKVIKAYFFLKDEDQPTNIKLNRTILFSAIFICISYFVREILTKLNFNFSHTNQEFLVGLSSSLVLIFLLFMLLSEYVVTKLGHKIPIVGEIVFEEENEYESVRDGYTISQYFRGRSLKKEQITKNIPTDLILNFLSFAILFCSFGKLSVSFIPTLLLLIFFFHNHIFHLWVSEKQKTA